MASLSEFAEYQRKQLPIALQPQDCRGRTYIVTGASSGLGYECAKHLARLEAACVVMAVRDLRAGESARAAIEACLDRHGVLHVWHLDLASFESVKKFAAKADEELDRVDALVCNAGTMAGGGRWAVKEGMEATLTVNLVSNMLLTTLMLPVMASKAGGELGGKPHVVHVGSTGGFHVMGPIMSRIDKDDILKDLNDEKKWKSMMETRYFLSKTMQHFSVRQLAARGPVSDTGVVVNLVDPGSCKTRLARNASFAGRFKAFTTQLFWGRTAEMGSRSLLAGIAAGEESHGKMMMNCEVADDKLPSWMTDEQGQTFQQQLWREVAEKLDSIQPGCLDCGEEE